MIKPGASDPFSEIVGLPELIARSFLAERLRRAISAVKERERIESEVVALQA